MNKRHLTLGLAASALFITLSAAMALADTTVKVLRPEVPENEKAFYTNVIADFEATHKGTKVSFEYLANEAYKQKLTTLLQSDQKPDIIFSWSGGVLEAAGRVRCPRGDITAAEAGDWAGSLSVGERRRLYRGRQDLRCAYWGASEVVFWVNRDLAQKAGIDPDGIKTWDDFLTAVKKAKAAGITPIVVGGKDKWPLHFYYGYLMVREAGKPGIAAAMAGEGAGSRLAPFVKAGEDFKALLDLQPFQPGFMDTTFEQATGQFGDGKAVFHLMGRPGLWHRGSRTPRTARESRTTSWPPFGSLSWPWGRKGQLDTFGGITGGGAVAKGASPQATEFLKVMSDLDHQKKGGGGGFLIPVAKGARGGDRQSLLPKDVCFAGRLDLPPALLRSGAWS